MGTNNNNIVVLAIVAVALIVGLVFAVSYKQAADAYNQQGPNQWQNWDNQPTMPPPVQPRPQPRPEPPDVTPTNPTSYQEAIDMSRRTGKKVFLYFHADWCSWCKKMERETLSDARVKQELSKYIVYYVDRDQERAVARKYMVGGIPAYCITDSSERASKRGVGYKSPQEFIDWLNGNDRGPFRPG